MVAANESRGSNSIQAFRCRYPARFDRRQGMWHPIGAEVLPSAHRQTEPIAQLNAHQSLQLRFGDPRNAQEIA